MPDNLSFDEIKSAIKQKLPIEELKHKLFFANKDDVLCCASRYGHYDLVYDLINNPTTNINGTSGDGQYSALSHACMRNNSSIISILIEAKADVNHI